MTPEQAKQHAYDLLLKTARVCHEAFNEIANDVFNDPTLFSTSQRELRKVIELAETCRDF